VSNQTYRLLIDDAVSLLSAQSDSPRIDAEVLMQAAIEQSLAWLISYGDTTPSAEHTKRFYAYIARRHAGEPIAYIVGHKEFWSLDLDVNKHVLVPRVDTETLVEAALDIISKDQDYAIADLGTGSGAIALAIAKERPQAKVVAIDVSEDALRVAQNNANKHSISNVSFLLSDWFAGLKGQQFDVIVSNPPYVRSDDPHLNRGDLPAEPDLALIGKDDGLGDIRRIVSDAKAHLKGDKTLIIEHGCDQGDVVNHIFLDHGFKNVVTHRDLSRLPRCTSGKLK
jgi:release factor glutamine methyltransferase